MKKQTEARARLPSGCSRLLEGWDASVPFAFGSHLVVFCTQKSHGCGTGAESARARSAAAADGAAGQSYNQDCSVTSRFVSTTGHRSSKASGTLCVCTLPPDRMTSQRPCTGSRLRLDRPLPTGHRERDSERIPSVCETRRLWHCNPLGTGCVCSAGGHWAGPPSPHRGQRAHTGIDELRDT